MDDYGDIEFVERNAVVVEGRSSGSQQSGRRTSGGRTFYAQPQSGRYPAQYGRQPTVMYANAPGLGGNLFGQMTTGQMIGLLAEVFATLMPLPAQPVATADTSTDVGNLILFQGSLAQYAKRDEQIRTLGNLVTKLVG